MERLKYIVNILITVGLLAAVSIGKDRSLFGNSIIETTSSEASAPAETTASDSTRIINSTEIAKDVMGFGGRTPVELHVKNDIIQSVKPLKNSETPSFFSAVVESGLFEKWQGMTLEEAASTTFDAVSGATYSSKAIEKNVQLAAGYAASLEAQNNGLHIDLKSIAGILVILLGVFITFTKAKNKVLIAVQLALNVAVLGFWCGSFLSLASFVAWISNGFNLTVSLVATVLLLVAFLMPLFGKKGTYCRLHCPMGSAQELLWMIPLTKIKINPKVAKALNNLRYYILSLLLFFMWIGQGFELMDYEIFSAFIVSSASNVVLVMAGIFLILSLFIHRPYCKYVCPTGALLTVSQKTSQTIL